MCDLREHQCDNLTICQYLAPSQHHLPVQRYVTPEEFAHYAVIACELGFVRIVSGPMVRSSCHAEEQARGQAPIVGAALYAQRVLAVNCINEAPDTRATPLFSRN